MAKKTYIHVNQAIIKRNAQTGERSAPLTVKDYRENRKAHEAVIELAGIDELVELAELVAEIDHGPHATELLARLRDLAQTEVARVVYRPDDPLDCGARVWIETRQPVRAEVREEVPA